MDNDKRGFKEVQRTKKSGPEGVRIQPKEKNIPAENKNKFQVLQDEEEENEGGKMVEEDNENAPMDIIKETTGKSIIQNKEVEEEMGENQENTIGQLITGPDNKKDNGVKEEKIMKKLLQ